MSMKKAKVVAPLNVLYLKAKIEMDVICMKSIINPQYII